MVIEIGESEGDEGFEKEHENFKFNTYKDGKSSNVLQTVDSRLLECSLP